jgi:hypothetical protein
LTFRIELALGLLLWLPTLCVAGVIFALYLFIVFVPLARGEDDPAILARAASGLCCVAVPVAPLALVTGLNVYRVRSMSARLFALVTELFQDARILEVQAVPPSTQG